MWAACKQLNHGCGDGGETASQGDAKEGRVGGDDDDDDDGRAKGDVKGSRNTLSSVDASGVRCLDVRDWEARTCIADARTQHNTAWNIDEVFAQRRGDAASDSLISTQPPPAGHRA